METANEAQSVASTEIPRDEGMKFFKVRMGDGLKDRVKRAAKADGLKIAEWTRLHLTKACETTENRQRLLAQVHQGVEARRKERNDAQG